MKLIKLNINRIATLTILIVVILYFRNNTDALLGLLKIPIWTLLLLIILKTIRMFVNGLFTKYTVDGFGKKMSFKESNYLSVLTSMGNFFGPVLGGASIRAVHLKKYHDLNYSSFISTLYGFYVVSFATNSLIALIALGLFYQQSGVVRGYNLVLLTFLGIFTAMILLIVVPPRTAHAILARLRFIPQKITKNLNMMVDGWITIRKDRPLLLKLALLNIVVFFIATIESYLLYRLFVPSFSLSSVILYTAIGTLSLIVSFTPGAIGIKEAIYLFTIGVLSINATQLLQMATVDRSTAFILLLIMLTVLKVSGIDKRASKEFKKSI